VRTTLEPKLQVLARDVLVKGLVKFDEGHGYRGPVKHLDLSGDWGVQVADVRGLNDVAPWRLAVVLETGDKSARIGLQPGREPGGAISKERDVGIIPLEGVKWAKSAHGSESKVRVVRKVSDVLSRGDVIYVEPTEKDKTHYMLRQVPEVSGALVAMDPQTGRVLAMVGGFSFDQSQFNRATQAMRQPGSSFKPFVYAAALDNGYTPSSIELDAPLQIDTGAGGGGVWAPQNYEGNFYGPSTLRFGIEHSRNVMTVRLAQDIGMPLIAEYAKRFGIYDELPPYLSYALGAGETTLLRMVTGYSMFDNGGKKITATLIDRIQDRYGKTIYRHDDRECPACNAKDWHNQQEPALIDHREQVLDPMTAYQITSMMEGVVQRGTATVVREVGKPIAGKTGTTNDQKDAWFIGFSPDMVVGVYVGYDKPRNLGRGSTGGHLAAPIVKDFLKVALADKPAIPFRVPAGIKLIRVDAHTGQRVGSGYTGRAILEAFKPGTAPPDTYAVTGFSDGQDRRDSQFSPDAQRAVRSGTGGLY
jgi:penicillin-binding protein 1A